LNDEGGWVAKLLKNMLKSMQVLETKSFESFCFLNQNTFLLEDFKSKDFETHFCFENKELLSPFF
jgi:hypothetical protein